MKRALADILFKNGLITFTEHQKISVRPLFLYQDLRTLLYLGLLLITTSAGILIYKNIDTIGHAVVVTTIAVVIIACFIFCYKNSSGYSHEKIEPTPASRDYVLLLGCVLLLTLTGYLQFQYQLFGNRLGLALFIPMILLFIAAYYFDHLGVLGLAITNLATWAGIAITPAKLLQQNDFSEERAMFSGAALGIFLLALSFLSIRGRIKTHFSFTYQVFGIHIFFVSMIAMLFHFEQYDLFIFLVVAAASFAVYKQSLKQKSVYFLTFTIGCFYVAFSYIFFRLFVADDVAGIYLIVCYFIISGIVLMSVFKFLQKKLDR